MPHAALYTKARRAARARCRTATRSVTLLAAPRATRDHPHTLRASRCQCKGACTACYSLIRKYTDGERRGLKAHFDSNALVTAVISLNSYGDDFGGGLYVSTGVGDAGGERFLALRQGDTVLHQGDLLHGVNVTSGVRWSWVMWFSDDPGCR